MHLCIETRNLEERTNENINSKQPLIALPPIPPVPIHATTIMTRIPFLLFHFSMMTMPICELEMVAGMGQSRHFFRT